ncbi:MAG: response regulator transcription factor [Candidatus Kryptoniota bacterium]
MGTVKKILLAEDTQEVASLLLFKLRKSGFIVHHAVNGEEALKMVNVVKPDLIILDVMMPVIDGFEVLMKLRENETTKSIPVLMLTSLSTEKEVVRGLQLGADDYLTKPFSPQELLVRVNKLLERSHAG